MRRGLPFAYKNLHNLFVSAPPTPRRASFNGLSFLLKDKMKSNLDKSNFNHRIENNFSFGTHFVIRFFETKDV